MKILNLLLLTLILAGLVSCNDKKEGCTDPVSLNYDPDAEDDDGSCGYGGTGGSTELVFFPKYNGQALISTAVYSDTAFVKFNAVTSPGTNPASYDMVIVGDPGEDHLHAFNMKKGKYYVYITGWDTIADKSIAGGMPVTVSQATGVVNFDVVTY